MTIKGVSAPKVQTPVKVADLKARKQEIREGVVSDKVQIDEGKEKEWLIIYYGGADNNLTSYLHDDLNEIEKHGSDQNIHMVALFDAGKRTRPFQGAKVFYLQPDNDLSKINSPVIKNLGQVNTADPEFMANFIAEMMKRFPAKHVAVIISDHGGGWHGAVEDDSHGGFMNLSDIRDAFKKVYQKTGRKVDVVGWDACLMAMGEVGYALSPYVNLMVASEQTEGADGWPYPHIFTSEVLKALKQTLEMAIAKKGTFSPEDFAKTIVKAAESSPYTIKTLSAVDLRKAKEFAQKVDAFAKAILKTDTPRTTLKDLVRKTEHFYGSFRDIADFARRVAESKDIKDKNLRKAAKELYDYITKEYVIANHRTESYHPNAYGVSIEMPTWGSPSSSYKNTDFAKDTSWDEAMAKINSRK